MKTEKDSILVIDDSIEMLVLQRTLLEMEGFEVFTAQSGPEALDVLHEIDKPSLILVDMQMGEMSGLRFLERLEVESPSIVDAVPVVFLTGQDVVPKSRAQGHILKGRGMNEFLSAVHHYIEQGRSQLLLH